MAVVWLVVVVLFCMVEVVLEAGVGLRICSIVISLCVDGAIMKLC